MQEPPTLEQLQKMFPDYPCGREKQVSRESIVQSETVREYGLRRVQSMVFQSMGYHPQERN